MKEVSSRTPEIFEDAQQIDLVADEAMSNFIEQDVNDLTREELESKIYRAARKANPQLARERQERTFTSAIKRASGFYSELEEDTEFEPAII